MDKADHAVLLKGFLSTIFEPDQTVHIFPCLSEAKLKEVVAGTASLPTDLHGRQLTYVPYSRDDDGIQWEDEIVTEHRPRRRTPIPRKVLNPFSRRAGSTNINLIAKLNDFVALGYDIYFCVNPLTYGYRSQRTVRKACHIVLESDDASTPIETQKAVFDKFKDSISAMVFSGNRSVHAFVRLSDAIWNVYPIKWETRHRLRINEEVDWIEYKTVAAHWIKKMEEHGLKVDTQVSMDCSRLTRLPGFNHSKTGKPSEVLFLNPNSSFDWYWELNMAFSFSERNAPVEPVTPIEPVGMDVPVQLSPSGILHNLSPIVSPVQDNTVIDINTIKTIDTIQGREEERRITSKTNVIHLGSFLDDLKRYEGLKLRGIPRRHVRRTLHKVMFTAARVFGMNEYQMADEWKRIVGLHPENIGCSIEEAVEELLSAFRAKAVFLPFLPNTRNLPVLDKHRVKAMEEWLVAQECTCTADVLKIIRNILWDCIKTLPLQCAKGQIGLKSSLLQNTCRGRGGYKKALAWMEAHNMVRMTDGHYIRGVKTRRFFVNVPLILYCAGFEAADLDWSQSSKEHGGQSQLQQEQILQEVG